MTTQSPRVPLRKNMFLVEAPDVTHCRFESVSEVCRKDGDVLPVTLTRAAVHGDTDLWRWSQRTHGVTVDIVVLDRNKKEQFRWRLVDCTPEGYSAGSWACETSVVRESITIRPKDILRVPA